ncbi:MAG TPA: phosphatidylserine/phosphatidylglycerophosphate/cardiolipin synthase family protein [Allosphingosinicella sp.]|nr:phosphatidylserine/phosphatidylglycerophosphate/cardiolipin synthase family protein [Allosphingosinicella sp.]
MSEDGPGIAPMVVDGNRLTLLADGPERLEALIGLIDGAEESLRVLYYIWENDAVGRRVRDALLAAAERGVRVSLLVDGFGASGASAGFFRPLVEAEARFCRFVPRWGRRYLLRNHQKLALADGRKVMVGGFNITSDYFGTIEEGAWRDLGLVVEGPSVACLIDYFDDVFQWAETDDASIRSLRRVLSRHSTRAGPLHWLFGGPSRRLSPWGRSVKADMQRARRLDIIACYFAPSLAMMRRIFGVARRGRARIVTPSKLDHQWAVGAARFLYWRLLKRGTEIYEYQATKLHSKLIVIDDVVHIGSANFDMRSLYLNLEMMLRVDDAPFAGMMRRFVDGEIADSKRILPDEHRARMGLWNRINWGLAYFVMATADYNVARRLNFRRTRLGSRSQASRS